MEEEKRLNEIEESLKNINDYFDERYNLYLLEDRFNTKEFMYSPNSSANCKCEPKNNLIKEIGDIYFKIYDMGRKVNHRLMEIILYPNLYFSNKNLLQIKTTVKTHEIYSVDCILLFKGNFSTGISVKDPELEIYQIISAMHQKFRYITEPCSNNILENIPNIKQNDIVENLDSDLMGDLLTHE